MTSIPKAAILITEHMQAMLIAFLTVIVTITISPIHISKWIINFFTLSLEIKFSVEIN